MVRRCDVVALGLSSAIALLLWLLILQQLCITQMPNSKRSRDQLVRMSVLSVFATFSLLLNALIYFTLKTRKWARVMEP